MTPTTSLLIVVVVLGFGTTSFVGFAVLNLYPLIYAVPFETFAIKLDVLPPAESSS